MGATIFEIVGGQLNPPLVKSAGTKRLGKRRVKFSVLHENGLYSPAMFFKFQTEFFSGCSPLWITCTEIEFDSGRCPIFQNIGL